MQDILIAFEGSYLCRSLVILKLLIGINLRAYAMARYSTIDERVDEERRNDRSRPAIGTNVAENVSSASLCAQGSVSDRTT